MTDVTTQSPVPQRSTACRVLSAVALDRPGICLHEVDAAAALQRRVDRTYLVTPGQLRRLGAALGAGFRALEIDSRRVMNYHSVYFDTTDLALFRAHRQGRRRRFKVRVRTYADSGDCFVEVKTKSGRGETVKHRIPHPAAHPHVLDRRATEFVRSVIREQYGAEAPQLAPVLESLYGRATLVDTVAGERLTCDVDLRWSAGGGRRPVSGPDQVLLESKTTGRGQADRILAAWGIRPLSMSKYAIGTALLHPQLAASKWNRLLRNEFGWQRTTSSVPAGGSLDSFRT